MGGTESVATLKFMAVHIRGVASAPGSRTSCLSKPWESGSSRMESMSSKSKKWKPQVIYALDFPPESCSLPSLLGCGSHVYQILVTCLACQKLHAEQFDSWCNGSIGKGLISCRRLSPPPLFTTSQDPALP